MKRVSEGKDLGECHGTFLSLKLILIVFFIITIFSYIYFSKTYFGYSFESQELELILYLTVAQLVLG